MVEDAVSHLWYCQPCWLLAPTVPGIERAKAIDIATKRLEYGRYIVRTGHVSDYLSDDNSLHKLIEVGG